MRLLLSATLWLEHLVLDLTSLSTESRALVPHLPMLPLHQLPLQRTTQPTNMTKALGQSLRLLLAMEHRMLLTRAPQKAPLKAQALMCTKPQQLLQLRSTFPLLRLAGEIGD